MTSESPPKVGRPVGSRGANTGGLHEVVTRPLAGLNNHEKVPENISSVQRNFSWEEINLGLSICAEARIGSRLRGFRFMERGSLPLSKKIFDF